MIVIIAIAGWYLLLHFVSKASETECNDHRVWVIEGYEIIEKQCLGYAGPHYYPVYLYRNKEKLDQLLSINDSTCIVDFEINPGDTLSFDLCNEKLIK